MRPLGNVIRRRPVELLIVPLLILSGCGQDAQVRPQPYAVPHLPYVVNDQPTWSPSGNSILYVHSNDGQEIPGQGQVWLLDLPTMTTRFVVAGDEPHWMGNDTSFSYNTPGLLCRFDLLTSRVDTLKECGGVLVAQSSPDGSTLALRSLCDVPGESVIWLASVASGVGHAIPGTDAGYWDFPAWSPDGSRLALSHAYGAWPAVDLAVMDTSGAQATRLTHETTLADIAPTWSRDGSWIYWTRESYRPPGSPSIWRAHPDGSGPELVLADADAPSASPGDTALVYAGFDSTLNTRDLWISAADGTHRRPLLPNANPLAGR
jgi:Tol biopolymer transport system component